MHSFNADVHNGFQEALEAAFDKLKGSSADLLGDRDTSLVLDSVLFEEIYVKDSPMEFIVNAEEEDESPWMVLYSKNKTSFRLEEDRTITIPRSVYARHHNFDDLTFCFSIDRDGDEKVSVHSVELNQLYPDAGWIMLEDVDNAVTTLYLLDQGEYTILYHTNV